MSAALPNAEITAWQAQLALGFERRPQGTVLKHTHHQGPLRVQRPFYPEEGLPHVYLLHPPGGVAGSDCLDIKVDMRSHSQAVLTSPGSTKFYRSAGETAQVRQHMKQAKGTSLEWFPQENIIFPGAKLNSLTRIDLASDSCFMGWEINCLGRPCIDERFDHGQLYSRLEVYRDQQPLLFECQRVKDESALNAAAGLRGYPMQAIFIATPCDESHLELVRETLAASPADFPMAATLIDGLLIVRTLGQQTEAIQKQLIPLWQALRPLLIHRPSVMPRIWST